MNLKTYIEELVNQILAADAQANELFVVEVNVAGSKTVAKITVLLDGDNGIDIDKCAQVSRRLGFQLDEQNILEKAGLQSAYVLEVSSPGIDTPLKLKRQYRKNIGRKVKVLTTDGKVITGKLEAVDEEAISLLEELQNKKKPVSKTTPPALIQIAWNDIDRTNVLVSFND